jgi:hypothetical protein
MSSLFSSSCCLEYFAAKENHCESLQGRTGSEMERGRSSTRNEMDAKEEDEMKWNSEEKTQATRLRNLIEKEREDDGERRGEGENAAIEGAN